MTPIFGLELRSGLDAIAVRRVIRVLAERLTCDVVDRIALEVAATDAAFDALGPGGGSRVDIGLDGPAGHGALRIRISGTASDPASRGDPASRIAASTVLPCVVLEPSEEDKGAIVMRVAVPDNPCAIDELRRIASEQSACALLTVDESRAQNRSVLLGLLEMHARRSDVERLRRELDETNRGVLALYAELDEKSAELRRAVDVRTRFISYVSHEFRTPVNSILALSRMLLDRLDGGLTAEQEKQVAFIRKGAEQLAELVSDLLDLARIDAGKVVIRSTRFLVADLFAALRGMMRPLTGTNGVALVFDEPADVPPLMTDESKIAQVLRNFIANALKFTEKGEVRVAARLDGHSGSVVFSVVDTGIGIAQQDQEHLFKDWSQLDGPIHARVKGAGLGLSLSKRLAEVLGGAVSVASIRGGGSTFSVRIPLVHPDAGVLIEQGEKWPC